MLGSTIINRQQHVGLQQLSALAGITHSFLGPSKKYKFIHDDTSGESALVCSCFRVFENLEPTCAVAQLVYETIQAHQKVYKSGSGCLLFLAGAWSRAALECLHAGITASHILAAMSEGMDICVDVCRKCSISTEGLGVVQAEREEASCHLPATLNVSRKTLNTSGQRKIKLSRHFCEARSNSLSTEVEPNQPTLPNVVHVAEGLSHGSVVAMNLVVEASQMQSKSSPQDISCPTFDVSKVVTCVLPGLPEEHACVLPGCVVLLSAEQASVAHHLKEQHLKVALINADFSDTFRHLGFSRPAGIRHVSDQSALLNLDKEEAWMVQVVSLLLNLDVNLILVSGLASEKVIKRCSKHQILVVEKVKVSVLKEIANATGGVPVTYATQLSKHCVGTGAKVIMWRDLSSAERKCSAAVNISTGGDSGLVTVILTSCVQVKLQTLEDQFWACAYRLHHTLNDKVVLPGAGATEMLCVHHLQKQAGQHTERTEGAADPYRGVVLRLMADGLIDYICTVMSNTGRFSKVKARTLVSQQLPDCDRHPGVSAGSSQLFSEGEKEDTVFSSGMKSDRAPATKIYDNLSVKLEAWRKALDLVSLVLQTDAEVITGVDPKADGHQEHLMLL